MKPYNADSRCPKCGGEKVSTSYTFGASAKEYLERRCSVCGYSWPEACRDAGPVVQDAPKGWNPDKRCRWCGVERGAAAVVDGNGRFICDPCKKILQITQPVLMMGSTSVDEAVEDARRWEAHIATGCDHRGDEGFLCSRTLTHSGDHVSVNNEGEVVARWPQVDNPAPKVDKVELTKEEARKAEEGMEKMGFKPCVEHRSPKEWVRNNTTSQIVLGDSVGMVNRAMLDMQSRCVEAVLAMIPALRFKSEQIDQGGGNSGVYRAIIMHLESVVKELKAIKP